MDGYFKITEIYFKKNISECVKTKRLLNIVGDYPIEAKNV